MVIDIKMCRFDNVPWGFRLVGGADYEYPLTVVKVRHDRKMYYINPPVICADCAPVCALLCV